jgi:hypothetical protein
MRTAQDLYAAAAALGMLQDAVWNGALQISGDFRATALNAFGVVAPGPVFVLPEAVLPHAAAGDTLDIGEQRYTVSSIARDGLGTAMLQLQRQ